MRQCWEVLHLIAPPVFPNLQSAPPMPAPVIPTKELERFRAELLSWYDLNQRRLPWRGTSHPYLTWVSEIMLQQTRVAAVLEHYDRFLRRFPTVQRLARARLSSVLAAWSGLGYYRRARMMHEAARMIARGGSFPTTAAGWLELPGIGRYTAAAIASIAFSEPVAVVDGNVERVLRRVLSLNGSSRPADLWNSAERWLARERPGDFNQAMMELGATVCLPRQPQCSACPIAAWCATRGAGEPGPKAARRKRTVAYALCRRDGAIKLIQRPQSSALMPAMWELPAADGSRARTLAVLRHSITVTDYRVRVVHSSSSKGVWVPVARARRLALTGLTRKILRHFQII